MATFISLIEAAQLIKEYGPKRSVLLVGENGIGKTAIHTTLSKDPEMSDYIFPPPFDCTQASEGDIGLPDLDRDRGVSRLLPNERFGVSLTNQRGVNGARPVFLMFDEFGKAPRYIQNMLSPVYYDRRIGAHWLPDRSIVVLTTNLAAEGLGDTLLAHSKNRLSTVYVRKPTYAEWVAWAVNRGDINEVLLATSRDLPQVFDSFLDYEEGGKYGGKSMQENPYIFNPHVQQDAYASPRSLHAASDLLNVAHRVSDSALQAALEGVVGAPFAEQLAARARFGAQLPEHAEIMRDPLNVPMPENPAALVMLVFRLINRVKTGNDAEAALTFIERMRPEMQQLFVFSVSDAPEACMRFAPSTKMGEMMKTNRKFF